MTSSPTMSRKRTIKPELDISSDCSSSSPSCETPLKKAKSYTSPKAKTPKSSPTKADAWTPELRLKLFGAYESTSQVKWDEVARKKLGNVKKGQACREQWQRTTGNKIKAAFAEKS